MQFCVGGKLLHREMTLYLPWLLQNSKMYQIQSNLADFFFLEVLISTGKKERTKTPSTTCKFKSSDKEALTIREWYCWVFWGMQWKSVCASVPRTTVPVWRMLVLHKQRQKKVLLAAKRRNCSRVYESHANIQNNGKYCSDLSNPK